MKHNFAALFFSIVLFLFATRLEAQITDQQVLNGSLTNAEKFPVGCIYHWVNDDPAVGLPAGGKGDIQPFTAVNTGKTILTATITAKPVTPDLAYITNVSSNSVSVINTATGAVISTIPVGNYPVSAAANPDGSRVYVANSSSNSVSVINTSSNSVIANIPVGHGPQAIAVSQDGSRLYVTANLLTSSAGTVYVINTLTNAVIAAITVGEGPVGIAISPDGKKVYVTNTYESSISVISTTTNTVVSTFVAQQLNGSIVFSNDGTKYYIANTYSGIVSVYTAANDALVAKITVGDQSSGVVISADGKTLYVANERSNTVSVINTETNTVIKTILVGHYPGGVSITSDGGQIYVVNQDSGSISVIDAVTNTVTGTIQVGGAPTSFGNFIIKGVPCGGDPVTFTIRVNPDPAIGPYITAGPATGNISSCLGSPSANPKLQQIKVSAVNLSANLTAIAPAGFELSLNAGSGYEGTVTITPNAGTVDDPIIYVRSTASAPAGPVSGNVVLTSGIAQAQNVSVTGYVYSLPLVNNPGDRTVAGGEISNTIKFSGTGSSFFQWTNDNPLIGLAASGVGDVPSFTAVNNGTTPVTAKVTVISKIKGHAFIPNSGDNTVSVVDLESGKILKVIPVGQWPYGVAVNPDGSRVYISNIMDKSVSVIDAATNQVIATIPVGDHPYGISVSPDGSRVYVANPESNDVSVINALSNTVIASISAAYYPTFTLVSPDGKRLYVGNQNSQNIAVFNTADNTLLKNIAITNHNPSQMATNADGSLLYVVTFDSANTLLVINTATYTVVSAIPIGVTAHGLAFTPDGKKIYVANTGSNTVSVINTATNSVSAIIPVGNFPNGISITPEGDMVYVVNTNNGGISSTLSVINTATDKVEATISISSLAVSLGNFITPAGTCSSDPVSFNITVTPAPLPSLLVSGTLSPLTTVYGTPSSAEQFLVSGSNLLSGILVKAPEGFEVSADNITFGNSINLAGTGTGQIPVYIRLIAQTVVGTYEGNILISATNAEAIALIPNSMVTPAQLTVTANNQIKTVGTANPVLTVTYSGFVNNETVAQLSRDADVTTNADATSPAGDYVITASNAAASNYTFTYVPGVLTIQPVSLSVSIPNTFTPNGDGINDKWDLPFLKDNSKVSVRIFNRWGENIYNSIGYATPWDGKFKNTLLPTGTYYYLVDRKNGQPVIAGWVILIR
jgi:gliding motility-associated-like protein